MEMIQTLNAQLAMMMFFAAIPMLGMMQAKRSQRAKIKLFVSEHDTDRARRVDATRPGRRV